MRALLALALVLELTACGPPGDPAFPAGREPAHSSAAVEGEVLGVDRVAPTDRLASGVQLRVSPGAEAAVVVDLAPDWYLDQQGLRFAPSERVRVEGTRVSKPGGVVIYATKVQKGPKTVNLRDPGTGRPLWPERTP
jgi:hypothetical protein